MALFTVYVCISGAGMKKVLCIIISPQLNINVCVSINIHEHGVRSKFNQKSKLYLIVRVDSEIVF